MPRRSEFLVSRNSLNVTISRARALAYLVCTDELLDSRARDVDDMRLISTLRLHGALQREFIPSVHVVRLEVRDLHHLAAVLTDQFDDVGVVTHDGHDGRLVPSQDHFDCTEEGGARLGHSDLPSTLLSGAVEGGPGVELGTDEIRRAPLAARRSQ